MFRLLNLSMADSCCECTQTSGEINEKCNNNNNPTTVFPVLHLRKPHLNTKRSQWRLIIKLELFVKPWMSVLSERQPLPKYSVNPGQRVQHKTKSPTPTQTTKLCFYYFMFVWNDSKLCGLVPLIGNAFIYNKTFNQMVANKAQGKSMQTVRVCVCSLFKWPWCLQIRACKISPKK